VAQGIITLALDAYSGRISLYQSAQGIVGIKSFSSIDIVGLYKIAPIIIAIGFNQTFLGAYLLFPDQAIHKIIAKFAMTLISGTFLVNLIAIGIIGAAGDLTKGVLFQDQLSLIIISPAKGIDGIAQAVVLGLRAQFSGPVVGVANFIQEDLVSASKIQIE